MLLDFFRELLCLIIEPDVDVLWNAESASLLYIATALVQVWVRLTESF